VTLVSTEAGPDRDTYGRVLRAVEIDGDDVGAVPHLRNDFAHWVRGYPYEDSRVGRDVRGGGEQRSRGIRRLLVSMWLVVDAPRAGFVSDRPPNVDPWCST
jgi:hypothetical protein